MYKVEPHTANLVAEPEVNIYKIECIHEHLRTSASSSPSAAPKTTQQSNGNAKTHDKSLEAQEKALISALEQFNIKVDKCIEEYGGAKGGKQAKKTSEKQTPKKAEEKAENKTPAKQDKKQAKKEEKKAKKEENKANNAQQKAEKGPVASSSDLPALSVPNIRSTASVEYKGLESNLGPFGYENKDLPAKFNAVLQYNKSDSKWVEVLKTVAKKRGEVEIGENASGDRSIKLELVEEGNVQLTSSIFCIPVRGRLAVWKVIGVLLGIFDFTDASLAGTNHQWLSYVDDLLKGHKKLDDLSREACNRLAPHDFLATNDAPSLADYIVCSVLSDASYLPNNVELWVKRMQN